TFVNNSDELACITTQLSTDCDGSNAIFAGAYLASFDPADVCAHIIGDSGVSPVSGAPVTFGYNVPAGGTFTIVVSEVTANAGCASYTIEINGLACPTPTPGPAHALNLSTRLHVNT